MEQTRALGHVLIPPGWIGYSAVCLKQQELLPLALASSASFLLGFLGLWRAYRMTLGFYRGAEKGEKRATPVPVARREKSRRLLVERQMPWFTGALALATLRALTRAPEIKMALLMPLIAGAAFFMMQIHRPPGALPAMYSGMVAAGASALAMLATSHTMCNVFGLDRSGFRALVLLPTPRDRILAAKNLAYFPVIAVIALLLLVLAKVSVRMPWSVFIGGLLQFPTAFLLYSLITNLLSIFAPYRMSPGTLKANKPKAIVFVAGFMGLLAMPLVMAPLAVPAGLQMLFTYNHWLPWLPVHPLASALVLGGAIAVYRLLLPIEGRLLQRREQTILKEVTEETE